MKVGALIITIISSLILGTIINIFSILTGYILSNIQFVLIIVIFPLGYLIFQSAKNAISEKTIIFLTLPISLILSYFAYFFHNQISKIIISLDPQTPTGGIGLISIFNTSEFSPLIMIGLIIFSYNILPIIALFKQKTLTEQLLCQF